MKIRTRILAVSSLLLAASPAFAGNANSNLEVSASVSANCVISAGPLAFGAYDPVVANASTPLAAQATLSVTCTADASASIDLDQGQNADAGSSATVPLRRLSDGSSSYLSYGLYQDGAHTVWGASSAAAPYTGTGTQTSVTVYGEIAQGQNVPSGSYADTVVATINF